MKFVRIFDPKSNINFVSYFRLSWILTVALFVVSIVGLAILGMPWGIDFLGGTEMQVKFQRPVSALEIREVLDELGISKNQVQQFGATQNNEMLVRIENVAALNEGDIVRIKSLIDENFPAKNVAGTQERILFDKKMGNQLSIWLDEPYEPNESDPFVRKNLIEQQRKNLAQIMDEKGGVELRKSATIGEEANTYGSIIVDEPQNNKIRYTIQFAGMTGKIQKEFEKKFGAVEIRKIDFVDSQVSRQLRTDGILAVIYAILAIVIYIAIRFDMYFSPGAVFSLVNDTLAALLVFIFFRVEFDTPSIAALLTIIGYSVNNTVVVYDRIRETLPNNMKKPLSIDEIKLCVNKAINDTLSRTINTTLTTLFASVAIVIFASGAIKNFAIVLSVGITVGAFSSVFVAPAAFLLAKKYIRPTKTDENLPHVMGQPTREERAKGVV